MRPATRWERFKRHFVWGQWSWRTAEVHRQHDQTLIVLGKLKVILPAYPISGSS